MAIVTNQIHAIYLYRCLYVYAYGYWRELQIICKYIVEYKQSIDPSSSLLLTNMHLRGNFYLTKGKF